VTIRTQLPLCCRKGTEKVSTGIEEQLGDVYIAAAGDVMQRQTASRISQVDDCIRRYKHLRYCRVASVARHVQRCHSCSNAAQIDTEMNDSNVRYLKS